MFLEVAGDLLLRRRLQLPRLLRSRASGLPASLGLDGTQVRISPVASGRVRAHTHNKIFIVKYRNLPRYPGTY